MLTATRTVHTYNTYIHTYSTYNIMYQRPLIELYLQQRSRPVAKGPFHPVRCSRYSTSMSISLIPYHTSPNPHTSASLRSLDGAMKGMHSDCCTSWYRSSEIADAGGVLRSFNVEKSRDGCFLTMINLKPVFDY